MACSEKLTARQREALRAAFISSDGYIVSGASRIWGVVSTAVHALVKKGLLQMHRSGDWRGSRPRTAN